MPISQEVKGEDKQEKEKYTFLQVGKWESGFQEEEFWEPIT